MLQKFLEVVSNFKVSCSLQQMESIKQVHRKWMVQQEGTEISEHHSFQDITDPHKTMHQHYGKGIREFHNGNLENAKARLNELDGYSNEILQHLSALEEELFN